MGRKKKKYEEEKPWCFYCDREFDDEKILIQHQRAKVREARASACERGSFCFFGRACRAAQAQKDVK